MGDSKFTVFGWPGLIEWPLRSLRSVHVSICRRKRKITKCISNEPKRYFVFFLFNEVKTKGL